MQCPACSSTRLSPVTETGPYNTSFRSNFDVDGDLMTVQINRGCICGDCGFVMLFAKEEHLEELQPVWEQLAPYER